MIKSRKKYLFFVLCILSFAFASAQNKTPNQLLHDVYAKIHKVKDYSVNAHIKVDIPFIKMLPINVTIYFKQKDKFKVDSKSIAIVPRQGFDQIAKIIGDTGQFTAMIQGIDKIGTTQIIIVNIIPLQDTSDIILGKFWIDPKQNLVLKSQLTTKTNGTMLAEYFYGAQTVFGLPDKMIFTVEIKRFKMPKGVTADMSNTKTNDDDKQKDNKRGKIYITLNNYKINQGIPDSIFGKE